MRAAWVLAKVNYVLLCMLPVVTLSLTVRIKRVEAPVYNKWRYLWCVSVLHILWVIWRLQETLHWDTQWRRNVQYSCIFTNTAYYWIEAVAQYLFACTSVERFYAIHAPLLWFRMKSHQGYKKQTAACGFVTGTLCSLLNISAVYTSALFQTCQLSDPSGAPVRFLIFVKSLNLTLIYLLPCTCLLAFNIAMICATRNAIQKFREGRSLQQSRKRVTLKVSFLVLLSAFMVFCLPSPIYELIMTVNLIYPGVSIYKSAANIITEAILWNINTIAFTMNITVALFFSN